MYTIMLIDMPFSNVAMPSIALTQLKSTLRRRFGNEIDIHTIYLNHDFATFLGVEPYHYVSTSMQSFNAGFGDWFFRQEAYPELTDNTEAYFRRCFPQAAQARLFQELVHQKRFKLGPYMQDLITLYKLDRAQLVGFTSMFMQNTASFALARKLKQRNPGVVTVMGGANCEFPMGEVIAKHMDAIDFVFSGPALKSFPEFVQYCLDGRTANGSTIRGVFSRHGLPKSGTDTIGEDLEIDSPVELDYDSFLRRFARYFPSSRIKPTLTFETSRGCWWGQRAHCTFCGLNGASMGYRSMKPEVAIRQFNSLFRYSGKVAHLAAVDNILPKSYLQDVLPALQTPENMEIFYEVKADLSERDVSVLAKARVKEIQPGIESLATSTLKLMKKGTTVFQNLNLLKLCARYGVRPCWNLLVGFPGEREEIYRRYTEILPLFFHLPPPSGVFPVRFDRFSPYHTQAEMYGLDLQPADFYSLVYPFIEPDLRNFSYYFTDRNVNAEYRTEMVKWIDQLKSLVEAWQSRWSSSTSILPQLHFSGDSSIVYDSRNGSAAEHSLGLIERLILNRLSRPVTAKDLIRQILEESGHNASGVISSLEGRGLIFREGDRLFSLVLQDMEQVPVEQAEEHAVREV